MSKNSPIKEFPSQLVISSYISTERLLIDFLQLVPYDIHNKTVWSPKLVTIILEACSQLDSLYKSEANLSKYLKSKRLDIKDYFKHFGDRVSSQWLVFWGQEPEILKPFESWLNVNEYQSLPWWDVYNNLKHDRLLHHGEATLECAVSSLAGLFISIARCEHCYEDIANQGWISVGVPWNPGASLGSDGKAESGKYVIVETGLFSFTPFWKLNDIKPNTYWDDVYSDQRASQRFRNWFNNYG
jgi:hypothetical protein